MPVSPALANDLPNKVIKDTGRIADEPNARAVPADREILRGRERAYLKKYVPPPITHLRV